MKRNKKNTQKNNKKKKNEKKYKKQNKKTRLVPNPGDCGSFLSSYWPQTFVNFAHKFAALSKPGDRAEGTSLIFRHL